MDIIFIIISIILIALFTYIIITWFKQATLKEIKNLSSCDSINPYAILEIMEE